MVLTEHKTFMKNVYLITMELYDKKSFQGKEGKNWIAQSCVEAMPKTQTTKRNYDSGRATPVRNALCSRLKSLYHLYAEQTGTL